MSQASGFLQRQLQRERLAFLLAVLVFILAVGYQARANGATPFFELPKAGLSADELAVLYLDGDQQSEAIARYYSAQRGIPSNQVIPIAFDPAQTVVSAGEFAVQKAILDSRLSDKVQALALAWAQPYRVDCMSISAAFATGYDTAYCATGCKKTRSVAYYHSGSTAPFTDFNIRPTMMLAANSLAEGFRLIDRGVSADNSLPNGSAYLLKTSDKNRSVRHVFFAEVERAFDHRLDIQLLNRNAIKGQQDILFYFTGAKSVPYLDSLTFLPGAMADHLTSKGGQLTDSPQMSALRWLEAGATGSYGSAIEPCNFVQKFPNPAVAMWHYLSGATLIEAYWKSVQMPGQGNFIGEPLAAPFNGYRLKKTGSGIRVYSPVLRRGFYRISSEDGFSALDLPDFGNTGFSKRVRYQQTQRVSQARPYIEIKPPFRTRYIIERL